MLDSPAKGFCDNLVPETHTKQKRFALKSVTNPFFQSCNPWKLVIGRIHATGYQINLVRPNR